MKLELFYPSKPYSVFQAFGENEACVKDYRLPTQVIKGKVNGVCPTGFKELYPLLGMKGHTGQDLHAPDGTILRAPHNGIVEEVQTEIERGLGVGIVTLDKRDMGEYGIHYAKTRQWHLKAILVKKGQIVNVGDPIGLADSTGLSSGSHNHFELKPVEKNSKGIYYNVFQDNGYFGSIDPAPYFKNMYSEDYQSISKRIIEIAKKMIEVLKMRVI